MSQAMLERAEYRRCDKGEDLEDIYRLRYKSYRLSDMVSENADDIDRMMSWTTPKIATKFGIYIDGELVSTLRIHHACSETSASPSTTVYGDMLRPMLAAGANFVDPSRFAADPDWSRIYPQIPLSDVAPRLGWLASIFACTLLPVDHSAEHAAFYARFVIEQIPRQMFPGVLPPRALSEIPATDRECSPILDRLPSSDRPRRSKGSFSRSGRSSGDTSVH